MQSISRLLLVKLPLVYLILFAMSGCATVSTVPVNSYCSVAKPISYDGAADTAETVLEIERHNSQWTCLCEQDCPKQVE